MTITKEFLTGFREQHEIITRSVPGWIISGFTLLTAVNSTYFFLFILKTGIEKDGFL